MNSKLLKRFYQFLKPWKKYAIASLFISLLLALLNIPGPFLTRYIIDNVITGAKFTLLYMIVGALILMAIFQLVSQYINGYFMALFRERVLMNVRLKMFSHIEQLSIGYFNNNRVGYLMSRISNDTSRLHGLMADTFVSFMINTLTFIVGVGAMFYLHVQMAVIALFTLPFFIYFHYRFSGRIRERSEKLQEAIGKIFEVIGESLSGIKIIKLFNVENREKERLHGTLKDNYKASINHTKTILTSNTVSSLFSSIGPIIILLIGIREVINGNLTLGSYIAFNSFLSYLYGPVQSVMSMNVNVQDSLASLKRIYSILDIPKEDSDNNSYISVDKLRGNIEFSNVSFNYPENGNFSIDDISFSVSEGDKVALVGQSGAGKTTIINLLCKFYNPVKGKIYIDGKELSTIKASDLRNHISMVPQEVFLFSGSIRENIAIGGNNVTEKDIIEASKKANIYSLIQKLPKGMNTLVGERGVKLSGGERQRIAIARAMLKDSGILIFDEATSEIDSKTEILIHQSLEELMKGKTTILIAHRLSTIKKMKKLLFVDNGKISAVGSHRELYDRIPKYRKMWDEQMKN